MPFEPWLKQPDEDEEPYDPDDPRLLVNILKSDDDKPVDWFLDHLEPELAPKDG